MELKKKGKNSTFKVFPHSTKKKKNSMEFHLLGGQPFFFLYYLIFLF